MARIDYQKRPILFMNIAKEILNKIENTIIIVAGDGPLLNKMIEKYKGKVLLIVNTASGC